MRFLYEIYFDNMFIDIDRNIILDKEQREAVICEENNLLILSGAGSGKTRLLTHRICHLIENKGVRPDNILAITFTNKATNEMRERISQMVSNSEGITIKTLHSFCAWILRANIDKLDGFDRHFTVYDSSDQDKLLKKVIKELNVDEDVAKHCKYHISKAKNDGLRARKDEDITGEGSKIKVLVIPTNEELMIARDVMRLI